MDIWFHIARALDAQLRQTAAELPEFSDGFTPAVRASDPRHADFQANGVLGFAKSHGKNPRAMATTLADALRPKLDPALVSLEVAGPGFLNFKLSPQFLLRWLEAYRTGEDFAQAASALFKGRKIVVDFPSPNTAKQMHVGHLRPMVIGEAIQRMLKFCGGEMICDNHIGDWGTNYGILILGIKRAKFDLSKAGPDAIEDLERLYKEGSAAVKASPADADAARAELVKLQKGDPENTALWHQINALSMAACAEIYKTLGVTTDVTLGESFYRDKVDRVYRELLETGLAEEDRGALVVWHDEHPRFARTAKPSQPFIIRKADGASNYGSTDLATVLYRTEHFKADEIVYVTDGRQQDHFQQLFLTAQKWFAQKHYALPRLRHVWFGTILGDDGKAIKTKSGDPVKLKALLREAVDRAEKVVAEKNPSLSAEERARIAESVGVGAVRYADLSQNRTGDYVFSWKKLLSFEGNTAPYLLYAGARIHSILRKAGLDNADAACERGATAFETPEEIALARKLAALPAQLDAAIEDLRPHLLCTYLYELAGLFSTFYNADKVLVDDAGQRARRLILCRRTLAVLESGMRLLGLVPLERM